VGRSSGILVGLLAAALPAAGSAQGLYLHEIPTASDRSGALDRPPRLRAFVASPATLAASFPGAVLGPDYAEIELGAYPELEPREPERFRAASFLIDFDEPAVRALHEKLVARHGASPSRDELREFAGGAIPTKSMERGWDLASRVADSGVGDCTEHAVLTAALARSVGRAARVALGVVVVRQDGGPHALGHAWTEIHEGGRWVPVDATPIAEAAQVLAYVPLILVAEEGPGYLLAIGQRLQRTWVRRVEVGRDAPPASHGAAH
jgi:hypothetical protein